MAPRLPTVENVGVATPRPTRGVASYRGGVAEQATQQAAASGARAAEQVAGIGAELQAAEQRIRDRNDAINRVREINLFNEELEKDLIGFQSAEDIASPDAIKRFGESAKQKMASYLANHAGSDESKSRLFERLDGLRSSVGSRVVQASFQAQRKLLTDTIGQNVNALAARAAENPGEIDNLFASLDGVVNEMAPALGKDDETASRAGGRSVILKAATASLIERGAYDEARAILAANSPTIQYLSPEDQRSLGGALVRAEVAAEKVAKAGLFKVQEAEQILGRQLTPAERQRLAGLASPDGRETPSQKIAGIETALGRRLTPTEAQKVLGVASAESGEFGAGITGRALSIITDDAPAFAAGLLTEPEERRFLSAVTQYTQPSAMPNPDTGLIETRSPTLPAFAAEALQRRGMEVPTPRGPAAGSSAPGAGGGSALPGSGPERTQAPDAMGGKTIFQMAGDIAGPIPAIGEALSRTPGVGEFVQAPQMTQARNFVGLVSRDLVRVLQNNPRYAEGERQAIEKEASVDASTIDTPSAFRNRLIAVDDALSVREQNAFKTATSSTVGREERIQALNVLNGIVNFRAGLGVPPRVGNEADWKKIPAGTQYVDPQGNIRTKGQGGTE